MKRYVTTPFVLVLEHYVTNAFQMEFVNHLCTCSIRNNIHSAKNCSIQTLETFSFVKNQISGHNYYVRGAGEGKVRRRHL